MVDGLGDEDKYQVAVNKSLLESLKAHLDIVYKRFKQVAVYTCGLSSQRTR